jgi:signal transduction histidine kinase
VTLVSNEPSLSPGATLYIEDNGQGIPTSERDKVFARGYRGRAVVDEVEGSGLGLAIAREMITRMGGLLDIVDEGPNRLNGTTVRVILFRDPEI